MTRSTVGQRGIYFNWGSKVREKNKRCMPCGELVRKGVLPGGKK